MRSLVINASWRTVASMGCLVLLTGLQLPRASWGAPSDKQVSDLVLKVVERVTAVVRNDGDATTDLSHARIRLLLATKGDDRVNAYITSDQFSLTASVAAKSGMQEVQSYLPLTPIARESLPAGGGTSAKWLNLTIVVGTELVSRACEMQEARLADIIGHEYAHCTLGHLRARRGGANDILMLMGLTRQQEFAADLKGLIYAQRAGYDEALGAAMALWNKMTEAYGGNAPLEPAEAFSTHPTHAERIAELQSDPARKQLYRNLMCFDNGVVYLAVGDWLPAQQCFEAAARSFSGTAEVLTNLGYSKMMRYYATLALEERQKIAGEVACDSFVTTRPPIHGGTETDKTPLVQAIADVRQALAVAPGFYRATITLGTALVMDPDATRAQLEQADDLLAFGAEAAAKDGNNVGFSDAVANRALALVRLEPALALGHLREAALRGGRSLPAALAHNLGVALASSAEQGDLREADQRLTEYLQAAPPGGYYQRAALGKWYDVRAKLSLPIKPAPRRPAEDWLPPLSIALANGETIRLQEEWDGACRALGDAPGTKTPMAGIPDSFTYDCPELGVQLRVSRGSVRAIIVRSPAAPSVVLKSARVDGGPSLLLRIGARQPAISDGTTESAATWESLAKEPELIPIAGAGYHWYPQGFALCQDKEGRIAAIALVSG